jgi:hypothetical protein
MIIKERDKFEILRSDCISHTFVDTWNILPNMNKNFNINTSSRNCIYENREEMYQIKQHAKLMCLEGAK